MLCARSHPGVSSISKEIYRDVSGGSLGTSKKWLVCGIVTSKSDKEANSESSKEEKKLGNIYSTNHS
ncbi:MAG: hypothetical protein AMXMBFR44_6870 [Candidatus Campbellbacteria bacterium]